MLADNHVQQATHLLRAAEHSLEAERLSQPQATSPSRDDLRYDLAKLFSRAAWIADERERYSEAIDFYKEARANDVDNKRPEITYNLACSYAKLGDYESALSELVKVIGQDENWEYAPLDADFDRLRADPAFGGRLSKMVSDAKHAAENERSLKL